MDSLTDHSAESDSEKVTCRISDLVCSSGPDAKDKCEESDLDAGHGERRQGLSPKPVTSSPLTGVEAPLLGHHHHHLHQDSRNKSKACLDSRTATDGQSQAVKPKLWSLAEIATSDPKQPLGQSCPSAVGLLASTASGTPPAAPVYSASSILGRPLYYTSPFYSNYTNYGSFSPLQGQGILRYGSTGVTSNEGLPQTVLSASTIHKHTSEHLLKSNQNQTEQHFRALNVESKKGRCKIFLLANQSHFPLSPFNCRPIIQQLSRHLPLMKVRNVKTLRF